MSRLDLVELCLSSGSKPVHAGRLLAYLFRHGITNIDKMPDIPARLRTHLSRQTRHLQSQLVHEQQAVDGTRKLLLQLEDGQAVETVLIPGPGRLTQCISTQAGCAIGCSFCHTAAAGLNRNLDAAEMVAQLRVAQGLVDQKVRNLVLMGMGEPLHNYDEVAKFVRIAADPLGMAFSPRRVTLSTAGLVPGIYRMIEDELPCNLAVSLNAVTDELRTRIMPINRKYPLAKLMQAIRDYIAARGNKRVLVEYVLLEGVNDSVDDAGRLAQLLAGTGCTINLLPFNPYPGSIYRKPSDQTVSVFRVELVKADFVAVVRESHGQDISAACGQLNAELNQRMQTA